MTYLRKKLFDFAICVVMFFLGAFLLWTGICGPVDTPLDFATSLTLFGLGGVTVMFSTFVGGTALVRAAYHLVCE